MSLLTRDGQAVPVSTISVDKISDDNTSFRSGERILALDGLRGFAIFMVLVWHYFHAQIWTIPGTQLSYIKQALGFTWSGVDLFFVLSGFLIAGILIDNKDKKQYFSTFYIRRTCRIFPLYYLHLLLFLVLLFSGLAETMPFNRQFQTDSSVPLWSYFVYVQNIFMGKANSFGPEWLSVTWSLAIEEQFYLLFPLLVRFIPGQRLPYIFLWFIIIAVYLRATMPGFTAFINTPWRADSLMIGALLAFFIRQSGFIESVISHRRFVYSMFFVFLVVALLTNFSSARPFILTVTYLWLAILFALLILICVVFKDDLMPRLFRSRALMWLGSISYGVYLFHQPISSIVHGLLRYAPPYISSWFDAMITLLSLFLTLILAHISYNYFEKKIIRFGRSFRYT